MRSFFFFNKRKETSDPAHYLQTCLFFLNFFLPFFLFFRFGSCRGQVGLQSMLFLLALFFLIHHQGG
ncbi:MAG: hypothetical protein JOS17DRAFT_755698 [Linnemannia elongata]|nr:MAG: hypothetical protein JOS17DRAFT_755698 [Linnemannia elongata]